MSGIKVEVANIASVDPAERALLRDALIQLNQRYLAFASDRHDGTNRDI